jgi:hypothetical protein
LLTIDEAIKQHQASFESKLLEPVETDNPVLWLLTNYPAVPSFVPTHAVISSLVIKAAQLAIAPESIAELINNKERKRLLVDDDFDEPIYARYSMLRVGPVRIEYPNLEDPD